MLSSPFGFAVPADDEFLLLVEFDFDPCSGALSGLILGAAAFANQAFESQSPIQWHIEKNRRTHFGSWLNKKVAKEDP
jgi:hypothetical protein